MIFISLEGGTKTQRNLTEDATRYFVKQLLPRKRVLWIDIIIGNYIKEDVVGYCDKLEKDCYKIELHNRGSLYEYLSYLAHEMTHLKQYVTGELVYKYNRSYWNGVDHTETAYFKQPWEKEAWKVQYSLAKGFISEVLEISYKKAKDLSPRTMKKIDWQMEYEILERICDGE